MSEDLYFRAECHAELLMGWWASLKLDARNSGTSHTLYSNHLFSILISIFKLSSNYL